MPTNSLRSTSIRESWRPYLDSGNTPEDRKRLALRAFFSLLLLLAIGIFGYLLFPPLFHPTTHYLCYTAGEYSGNGISPIPFFEEDAVRFLSISSGDVTESDLATKFILAEKPSDTSKVFSQLSRSVKSSSDVAIISCRFHGGVQNGRPILFSRDLDPTKRAASAIDLSEFLARLESIPIQRIILLLDVNEEPANASFQSNSIDFVTAVEQLVKSTTFQRVSIVTSHSENESAFTSMRLQGSVFGWATRTGLAGLADENQDNMISLRELIEYVASKTNAVVQRESNGVVIQTPKLIGGLSILSGPLGDEVLASVPSTDLRSLIGAAELDDLNANLPNAIGTSSEEEKSTSTLASAKEWFAKAGANKSERVQEIVEDQLTDGLNVLPSYVSRRIKDTLGIDQIETPDDTPVSNPDDPKSNDTKEPPSKDGMKRPSLARLNVADPSLLPIVQLLWEYCEHIESQNNSTNRPIDQTPAAWQSLVTHIHDIESKTRNNAIANPKLFRLDVFATLVGLHQWMSTGNATVGDSAMALTKQSPRIEYPGIPLASLSMHEAFVRYGTGDVKQSLAQQIALFDGALKSSEPELFKKWIEQLPPGLDNQYREFFVARSLEKLALQSWPMCRDLLIGIRRIEQLALAPDLPCANLDLPVVMAHRSWLEGYRSALDQIGDDWADRTSLLIAKATSDLESASRQHDVLVRAIQLRNDTLARLPAMILWSSLNRTRFGNDQIDLVLCQLIEHVSSLNEQLLNREQTPNELFLQNCDMIRSLIKQIDSSWIELAERLLKGEIEDPGHEAWTYDALLSTPLIRGELRSQLLRVERSSFQRKADRESSLLAAPILQKVRGTSRSGQLLQEKIVQYRSTWETQSDSPRDQSAINSISSIDRASIENLLALRRKDTRNRFTEDVTDRDLAQQDRVALRKAELGFCLLRHERMLTDAIPDSLPEELSFLSVARERIGLLVDTFINARNGNWRKRTSVIAEASSDIRLETEPERSSQVVFRNRGEDIQQAWLLVDYDPSLLEVTIEQPYQAIQSRDVLRRLEPVLVQAEKQLAAAITASSSNANQEGELQNAKKLRDGIADSLNYPVRPLLGSIASNLSLQSGQELVIGFKVKRLRAGPSVSKISWKLVTPSSYLRADNRVLLPMSEDLKFVVDSTAGDWAVKNDGIRLNLNPNRTTEIKLGIVNRGPIARTVDTELFTFPSGSEIVFPIGWLDSDAAASIANQLGSMKRIASIPEQLLDSSGKPTWFVLAPSASTEKEEDPSAGGNDKEGASKRLAIPDGMVAMVTDRANKKISWHRIQTRVRHPRSYVDVFVGYDATAERINIQLSISDARVAPSTGINVTGRISQKLARGTEMKLSGTLTASSTLKLYCQVPPSAPRDLTLELDIDGFPRAFVVQVPCWKSSRDLPITMDSHRLAIVSPKNQIVFGPKQKNVEVELNADTLPGSFDSKRDLLEVGWDIDQDRTFEGENPIRLHFDRDVYVDVERLPTGNFLFNTKVSDLKLVVPRPPTTNRKVNLLARVFAAGETAWSETVEAIVDEEPPIITGLEVKPDLRVGSGAELTLKIGAEDGNLSGVAQVFAAIDVAGIEKWEDVKDPIPAERKLDASWVAKIPTSSASPGKASLVYIAIDRAGNQSKIYRTPIEIVDTDLLEAEEKRLRREVSGVVTYSGTSVSNAKASLFDEDGRLLLETRTDDRGFFRWSAVPIGKHRLTIIGVVKNKPRKSETTLDVDSSSKQPIRLNISLK